MDKGITSEQFKKLIDFAYNAYQKHNVTSQEYRQDGKVPYIMHPLWCATLLLNDQLIPFKKRKLGFQVLLLHDVIEDTDLSMPDWISREVRNYVQEMTFSTWEEAKREKPKKSIFMKLLFLYDALSSMYEFHVSKKKQKEWKKLTNDLLEEVENHYGNIRIVQIAKPILENTNWD